MGALFGAVCYPSVAEAADAFYTTSAPSLIPGATSYVTQAELVAGVWKLRSYSYSGTGTPTMRADVIAPVPGFPTCDPLEAMTDGMTVGWGIVIAMAIAWAIKNMRRGL